MISDNALIAMRCAAAVAAAVPSVRIRIHADDRTLLDVSRDARCEHSPDEHGTDELSTDEHSTGEHDDRQMSVTTFHNAVSMAHDQRKAGNRLGLRGLDDSAEPDVGYVVGPGDEVTPGGLLRVAQDGRWLHLVALAGRDEAIDDLLVDPVTVDEYEVTLATHADPWVEVTIVHIATDAGDRMRSSIAFEALHDVAARAMVLELEAFLDPVAPAIAPPYGSTGL